MGKSAKMYAHKKGEVVEPAGGETGVPHCLAEVRKLPEAALYCYFKDKEKINAFIQGCQTKK
jgi:hypothetical protein